MRVTLRQLESFVAVAEHGSFSSASRKLSVAQPALSKSIKELEGELGLRLLDRTTRRVELTAAGHEFSAAAIRILGELKEAIRDAHDITERRRGVIRVAAPPLLAAVVLPRAIADFRSRFPGVAVKLLDVGTEQIVEEVRHGRADCGLGTFPPHQNGVEGVTLFADELMLFCQPNTLGDAVSVRWTDLADLPLVTLTRDSGIRLLVEVGYESAALATAPAFEVAHITTALALVQQGLGVAVLPAYVRAISHHYGVVSMPLTHPTLSRKISIVHRSGRTLAPAAAEFVAVIRREVHQLTPRNAR